MRSVRKKVQAGFWDSVCTLNTESVGTIRDAIQRFLYLISLYFIMPLQFGKNFRVFLKGSCLSFIGC